MLGTLREHCNQRYTRLTINPTNVTSSYHYPLPLHSIGAGWGVNKILVGTVVKSKVDELQYDVREVFSRCLRKKLTVVFQGVSGKRRSLVRFQYGCENYLTLHQQKFVTIERRLMTEEAKMLTIYVILLIWRRNNIVVSMF